MWLNLPPNSRYVKSQRSEPRRMGMLATHIYTSPLRISIHTFPCLGPTLVPFLLNATYEPHGNIYFLLVQHGCRCAPQRRTCCYTSHARLQTSLRLSAMTKLMSFFFRRFLHDLLCECIRPFQSSSLDNAASSRHTFMPPSLPLSDSKSVIQPSQPVLLFALHTWQQGAGLYRVLAWTILSFDMDWGWHLPPKTAPCSRRRNAGMPFLAQVS